MFSKGWRRLYGYLCFRYGYKDVSISVATLQQRRGYLNGTLGCVAPLKEKVYMKQASGHEEKGKESWVCRLIHALYGTKQAANAWQLHLRGLMVAQGFTPLILDPATYVKRVDVAFTVVGTHVDD